MINVHASLLPRWRGAAPVHRAVIAGDPRDRRHDHARRQGARRRADARSVRRADWARRDQRGGRSASRRPGRRAARSRSSTRLPRARGRRHRRTTRRRHLRGEAVKDGRAVDWSLPAGRIHNLVRGLQPWPLVDDPRWDAGPDPSHRTDRRPVRSRRLPGTIVRGRWRHACRRRRRRRVLRILRAAAGGAPRDDRARVPGRHVVAPDTRLPS